MGKVYDLQHKIIISIENANITQAEKLLDELQAIEMVEAKIISNILKSQLLRYDSKFNKALVLSKKAMNEAKTNTLPHLYFKAQIELGYNFRRLGRLDAAIETIYNLEDILRTTTQDLSDYDYSNYLNLKGLLSWHRGNLDQALNAHRQAIEIRTDMGRDILLAISYNNLGIVYLAKGYLDKAKDNLENSLQLWEHTEYPRFLGYSYKNLGLVYAQNHNLGKALEYLERSFEYWQSIDATLDLSDILFEIIHLHILHDIKGVDYYLNELKTINQKTDHRLINQRYLLSKALISKREKSLKKLAESQKILERVLNGVITDFRIYILCSISICEILLDELKISENQQTIDDFQDIINGLYEFAQREQSYIILIESLILKSKLALIKSDFSSAQKAMDQAGITASEKDLHHLEEKISKEKMKLSEIITNWEQNLSDNLSLKERIEEIEMLEYLKKIKETKYGY